MAAPELVSRVSEALSTDAATYAERAHEEAAELKSDLRNGTFDNPQASVGMEYELYGVNDDGALVRVPRRLLDLVGFEPELGLHNAELHTDPQPFNEFGLAAQRTELQARLAAANERAAAENIRLVSDGMWTIPPVGESARDYLDDSVEYDGLEVTVNMSESVRYQAFTNSDYEFRRRVDPPGANYEAETPLAESLTTSIQPHYQVPYAPDLPDYFAYALRVAGPLLALGVNSPFLPPELYDADPETVLAEGYHENRVAVFEGMLNPADDRPPKVRFPRDVETVGEAVDRIAEDETAVPMVPDEHARYDDRYRHLRHKHGSYWRWVRPVFDAPSEAAANARVEFRALPAQPTVRDSVAFLATFAGLVEGMVRAEHPVRRLEWERARENFYAAVADGLDAEFSWVTADGEETTDTDRLYEDLFAAAREGLVGRGLPDETAERYLRPLRGRVRRGCTPAGWKRRRIREALEDGASFREAVEAAQREYVRRQRETLLRRTFLDWLEEAA